MLFNQVFFLARQGVEDISVHISVLFERNALILTVVEPFHLALGLIPADVFVQSFAVDRQTALVAADYHIEVRCRKVYRP